MNESVTVGSPEYMRLARRHAALLTLSFAQRLTLAEREEWVQVQARMEWAELAKWDEMAAKARNRA